MIVLTVKTFNGAPVPALSASFDELGGSIGRADNNQLVLPDRERSISRIHARIVYRNGNYAVVDHGSNPVLLNGIAVGSGREAPLRDGDQLQIGGYVVAVVQAQRTAAADVFPDIFGTPFGAPANPPPNASAPVGASFGAPVGAAPGAAPMPPASGAPKPFDPFDFDDPSPPARRDETPPLWSSPAASPPSSSASGWPGGSATNAGANLFDDLPIASTSKDSSLDDIFGLGGDRATSDPLLGGPLGNTALPNTSVDDDPIGSLLMDPTPSRASVRDDVPDLNMAWPSAPMKPVAPPPVASPTSAPTPTPAPAPLPGAVLSWDSPSRERTVIRPGTSPRPEPRAVDPFLDVAQPLAPARQAGPLTPDFEFAPSAPAAAPAGAAAPARQNVASQAAPDALGRAFAEGLGLSDPAFQHIDEAQMRLIGSLLRSATQGTVELLQARSAFKREMRSDVTMVVARGNNPMKFSPSSEVALKHLLAPPMPGFMNGADAMRDSFDDLRAHQLGMVAGMRSALEGVLQRFDPAVLETRITKRSTISALLPSGRKARLWELFQELYTQLSSEASEDFQELFGKAFRQAYEAHIDQLHSRDRGSE